MNSGVSQCANTNGDIGAFLQQIDNQVIGVQLQFNLWETLAETGDQRHDHMFHKGRGSVDP
ncbi:hypothetical protein D3C80_2040820 [compost metagenome]